MREPYDRTPQVNYVHRFKCAVCGKSKRAKDHNGDKCSRIMQQRRREAEARSGQPTNGIANNTPDVIQ